MFKMLGWHTDGRPLSYNTATREFYLGDTTLPPVKVEKMADYEELHQIEWIDEAQHDLGRRYLGIRTRRIVKLKRLVIGIAIGVGVCLTIAIPYYNNAAAASALKNVRGVYTTADGSQFIVIDGSRLLEARNPTIYESLDAAMSNVGDTIVTVDPTTGAIKTRNYQAYSIRNWGTSDAYVLVSEAGGTEYSHTSLDPNASAPIFAAAKAKFDAEMNVAQQTDNQFQSAINSMGSAPSPAGTWKDKRGWLYRFDGTGNIFETKADGTPGDEYSYKYLNGGIMQITVLDTQDTYKCGISSDGQLMLLHVYGPYGPFVGQYTRAQ